MSRTPGDWNARVIAEFRKNHGKLSGYFGGTPLLLLHTVGRKTGNVRVNPVVYLRDGERYLVFASKGGADTNPDWYYNLKAHPNIQVEVGDETVEVSAEEVTGSDREMLFARQSKVNPAFAEYQQKTKRIIPVMALTPRPGRE